MMGLGGVDRQIQERVDAYRGNPQQLMQRYQQNQQLIDLLALQKLKSEKDAAAREMQMKMQTTPQTIKDQREAEMLQRTKDELVQQTSGIMQQRQRQQQQNMQRTANQGLPQLPAGNMQKMAGGGIVAFAEGGDVKAVIERALQEGASLSDIEKLLRGNPEALAYLRSRVQEAQKAEIPYGEEFDQPMSLASMGERPAEGMRVPDRAPQIDTTDIMSLLGPKETVPSDRPPTVRLPEREPSEPSMGRAPAEARSIPSRAPQIDVTNLASLLGPKKTEPYRPPEKRGGYTEEMGRQLTEAWAGLAEADKEAGYTPPQRESGIAGEVQQRGYISPRLASEAGQIPAGSQLAPPPKRPGYTEEMGRQLTEAWAGLAEADKEAAAEQKRAQQMNQLPEDIPTGTDLAINQLKKALAEQNDPDKLRRERLRNFLLGAAGGTSISSALAGAGARSNAVRKAQEQARIKGIEQLANMEGAKVKNEIEARSAKALEDIRAAQTETQRFAALASAAQSNSDSLEALKLTDEEYKKAVKRLQEARDSYWVDEDEVRKAELAVAAELQRLKDSIQGYDFVSNAYQAMARKFQGIDNATGSSNGTDLSQWGNVEVVPQ